MKVGESLACCVGGRDLAIGKGTWRAGQGEYCSPLVVTEKRLSQWKFWHFLWNRISARLGCQQGLSGPQIAPTPLQSLEKCHWHQRPTLGSLGNSTCQSPASGTRRKGCGTRWVVVQVRHRRGQESALLWERGSTWVVTPNDTWMKLVYWPRLKLPEVLKCC